MALAWHGLIVSVRSVSTMPPETLRIVNREWMRVPLVKARELNAHLRMRRLKVREQGCGTLHESVGVRCERDGNRGAGSSDTILREVRPHECDGEGLRRLRRDGSNSHIVAAPLVEFREARSGPGCTVDHAPVFRDWRTGLVFIELGRLPESTSRTVNLPSITSACYDF